MATFAESPRQLRLTLVRDQKDLRYGLPLARTSLDPGEHYEFLVLTEPIWKFSEIKSTPDRKGTRPCLVTYEGSRSLEIDPMSIWHFLSEASKKSYYLFVVRNNADELKAQPVFWYEDPHKTLLLDSSGWYFDAPRHASYGYEEL